MFEAVGRPITTINHFGNENLQLATCVWQILRTYTVDEFFTAAAKMREEARVEWLDNFTISGMEDLNWLPTEEKKKGQEEVQSILQVIETFDPCSVNEVKATSKFPSADKCAQIHKLLREMKRWRLEDFQHIYQWLRFGMPLVTPSVGEEDEKKEEKKEEKEKEEKEEKKSSSEAKEKSPEKSIYLALQKLPDTPAPSDARYVPYGMVKLKRGKMSSRKVVINFNGLKSRLREFILREYPHTPTYLTEDINPSTCELSPSLSGSSSSSISSGSPSSSRSWSAKSLEPRPVPLQLVASSIIKYGMLKQDTTRDIVFDLLEWGKPGGDTGPYLMYVYARMKSILRNCISKGSTVSRDDVDYSLLTGPQEAEILWKMCQFWPMVRQVVETCNPAPFCKYLFNFCRRFDVWFECVPPLIREDESSVLFATRRKLLQSMAAFLKRSLYLLGIETLERM